MLKNRTYRESTLALDPLVPLLDEGFDDTTQDMWLQDLSHMPHRHLKAFRCTSYERSF